MVGWKLVAVGPPPSREVAHLPDHSEELARTADLTVTVQDNGLKLHRAVLAAGSRVLRTALCACDSDSNSAAAAVQAAFEGSELGDVTHFLSLLYDPLDHDEASIIVLAPEEWLGVLALADKLDCPSVLKACDLNIPRSLAATSPNEVDWTEWLLRADRLHLHRTAAHCVPHVVRSLLNAPSAAAAQAQLANLKKLGQPAAHLLFTALLKAVRAKLADGTLSRFDVAVAAIANWVYPADGMQMASTSGGQAEGEGPNPAIAHLPDASEELGRSADLTITVEGQQLKLHSTVAAAGSRVLRTALCACAGGDSGGAAAAVQTAFEGCKLADVQLFLKLLYDPISLESGAAAGCPVTQPDSWRAALALADKLDAPSVLQGCGMFIAPRLKTAAAAAETDWMGWLLLADKLRLNRVTACCAAPVVKRMVDGAAKQDMARLAQLGQPAAQVLFAVLLRGVKSAGAYGTNRSSVSSHLPSNVDWKAPENLF